MNLHKNIQLFQQAIRVTSDRLQIPSIYIEKDYWVTYALYLIFHDAIGRETIFKGGTALSKCFNFIERFSEDVDLVVLRHEGESDSRLKSKLKAIGNVIQTVLPEIEIEGLTRKRGMIRKTAHTFPKKFEGNYGQIREFIVLESTWLGNYEPYEEKNIISMVGKMMQETGQEEMARTYELLPFPVQILSPLRTICEKIMSLVRFSHSDQPIDDLKNKVRHIYDLHQLLQNNQFADFLHSTEFEKMLIQVGKDDFIGFRNNNEWLDYHPSEALIFQDTERVWPYLKDTYKRDFKNYVYGELPHEEKVLETLIRIKERVALIQWPGFTRRG